MFGNTYKGKKIIITGNTGFKGSWLTLWLLSLQADVVGISKDVPTNPSLFEDLNLSQKIKFYNQDIRDLEKLEDIIKKESPDYIFHLAAQAIVSISYENPIETISSNVIGTANVLECLRKINKSCIAIVITSDKAYDNIEQIWGYKEDDKMGGKDIYSGSKGSAELIIKSYYNSFFCKPESNIILGIGRAGNVIGGGDWAKDRIVVDCFKSWSLNEKVVIRSPRATRPWQHVLEPLSGYLRLGQLLNNKADYSGEGFNFGPKAIQNSTVEQLINDLTLYWDKDASKLYKIEGNIPFDEAKLLKLNCDKALAFLDWHANLDYHDTIRFTGEWYKNYFEKENMLDFTLYQIDSYQNIAKSKKLKWTE